MHYARTQQQRQQYQQRSDLNTHHKYAETIFMHNLFIACDVKKKWKGY